MHAVGRNGTHGGRSVDFDDWRELLDRSGSVYVWSEGRSRLLSPGPPTDPLADAGNAGLHFTTIAAPGPSSDTGADANKRGKTHR
jgi:hypothetical protein